MSTEKTPPTAPVDAVVRHRVNPLPDRFGRFQYYQAKVGTHSATLIIVKRVREFFVGQRIDFAEHCDLQGMCQGVTPRWRSGIVWKIEFDRLFVDRC